jgi:hypothetical protein
MCDYSLESKQSRPAVVGEKLITHNFGCGTSGFASVEDHDMDETTAVCLLPGTELAFDEPVKVAEWTCYNHVAYTGEHNPAREIEHKVARFTKINANQTYRHHDGLEFPDHVGVEPVLLTRLVAGQVATVLQMPAVEVPVKVEEPGKAEPINTVELAF